MRAHATDAVWSEALDATLTALVDTTSLGVIQLDERGQVPMANDREEPLGRCCSSALGTMTRTRTRNASNLPNVGDTRRLAIVVSSERMGDGPGEGP